MIVKIETENGIIQYSNSGKIMVDEKGNRYITVWGKESVVETNEDCDKSEFDEIMRELNISRGEI